MSSPYKKLDPGLVAWHDAMRAGQEMASAGRVADAETAFRRAIRLFPTRMEAWANLGAVLSMRADYVEAVRVLERARSLAPDSATVLANLATTYFHLGRYGDAMASCRRALAIAPCADGFNQLGAMLRASWRLEEAEAALRNALTLDARHGNALVNLATTLMLQGRHAEARAWLDRAADLPLSEDAAREAAFARRMLAEWWRLDPILRDAFTRADFALLSSALDAVDADLAAPDAAIMPFFEDLTDSVIAYPASARLEWPIPMDWPWIEAHFAMHAGDATEDYLARRRADLNSASTEDALERARYARAVESRRTPAFGTLMREHPEGALRYAHWLILDGLDDARYCPGHFKLQANRVIGNASEARARPEHVAGSLRDFHAKLLPKVRAPESRALLIYMVTLKCHPFIDGNGRVARYMCNAELEQAGLPPILIADAAREDWVRAQRVVYRTRDLSPLLEEYLRARDFTRAFLDKLVH